MAAREKFDGWKPNVEYPQKGRVRVNGTDQLLTITEKAVMFEGPEGIWGFDRSAVRAVSLVKGEYSWNIVYSLNGEIKSVRVEIVAWSLGEKQETPKFLLLFANSFFEFVSEEDHNAASNLDDQESRKLRGEI